MSSPAAHSTSIAAAPSHQRLSCAHPGITPLQWREPECSVGSVIWAGVLISS